MTATKAPPFGTRAFGDVDASLGADQSTRPDNSAFDAALQSLDPQTRAMFTRIKQQEQEAQAAPPPYDPAQHGIASKTEEEALPITPPPGRENAPEYTDRQGNGLNMAEEKLSRDSYRNDIIRNADFRDIKTYPSTGVKVEHYLKKVKCLDSDKTYNEEVYVVHRPGEPTNYSCLGEDKKRPLTVDENGNFIVTSLHNGSKYLQRDGIGDASDFLPDSPYSFGGGIHHGKGRIAGYIFPDGKIAITSTKGKIEDHKCFIKTREGGILTIDSNKQLVLADADRLPLNLPQQDKIEHLAFASAVQNGTKSMDDIIQNPTVVAQEEQKHQELRDMLAKNRAKADNMSFVDKIRNSSTQQRQL